jgi:ribonuclease P protein component
MKKSYRIKKESDFQRVFETHNSVANHKFVIYQMQKPNQPHFRVGISVGKKVATPSSGAGSNDGSAKPCSRLSPN